MRPTESRDIETRRAPYMNIFSGVDLSLEPLKFLIKFKSDAITRSNSLNSEG